MNLIFLFLIGISTILSASSMKALGLSDSYNKTNTILEYENAIVWTQKDNNWSVSEPLKSVNLKNYNNGYVLLNSSTEDFKVKAYEKNYYQLKKGWNYIASPKDGIDIVKSFESLENIEFVYVYDKPSQAWAGYSPKISLQKKMANTRILSLKFIEPGLGFYVYALEDTKVNIYTTQINQQCQKAIDQGFEVIIATGRDKEMVFDKNKTIGIESRYKPHYRQGVYNDSRVAMIYKDMKSSSKKLLHYGIVQPSILLSYSKEREDSYFFVYDYLFQECYLGAFPSQKIPPFSSLKKIK